MICPNCSTENNDSSKFCKKCGTDLRKPATPVTSVATEQVNTENVNRVNNQPDSIKEQIEQKPAEKSAPATAVPNNANAGDNKCSDAKKKGKKKEKKKKRVVITIVALILVFALVVPGILFLVFGYPFKVSSDKKTIKSESGTLESIVLDLDFNQPVRNVKFAINPEDSKNAELYTDVIMNDKNLFSAKVSFPNVKVPVGEGELWIYAESIVGMKAYLCIKTQFDIGYVSQSDPEAVEEIAEGIEIFANELIVSFEDDIDKSVAEEIIGEYDGEVVGYIRFGNQYQVKFEFADVDRIDSVKAALEGEEGVVCASYNYLEETDMSVVPNDSEYNNWKEGKVTKSNWGLECIDAPEAWEYNDQMTMTAVGVIDSSIDYDHSDLLINSNKINYVPSDDFATAEELMEYFHETKGQHASVCPGRGCEYCSYSNHGTHCAGIIGATADNDNGICGVNWKADLYFASHWTYSEFGTAQITRTGCSTMQFHYNIAWMVASGCRVISFSVGSNVPEDVEAERSDIENMDRLFKSLEDNGYDFLFIKAAGNDNTDASCCWRNRILRGGETTSAHTIIVGAVEDTVSRNGYGAIYNMASYSNYGEFIDICAPGSQIYSTVMGDGYAYMDGTSMATPMVAGVASLVYSVNPELTYDEVKEIVCGAYKDYCYEDDEGKIYGIVNAGLAVKAAVSIKNGGEGFEEPVEPICGFVTGSVVDAKTGELIGDGEVEITAQDGTKYIGGIFDGKYSLFLSPGKYTMTVSSSGYVTETIYNVDITEGVTTYNVKLNLVTENISGGVSGVVVDAFDGSYISGATLKFYKGIDNTNASDIIYTTTSDSYGEYYAYLPAGNYTVVLTKSGYLDDSANILVVGGQSNPYQNCAMTPILNDGEVRFVLTWDKYPEDLDAHLLGPTEYGDRFHIFWYDMNSYGSNGEVYNNLDLDDMHSYGPETTSIYVAVDGTYNFYVHDYTNRSNTFTTGLAESGARVKIYIAGRSEPYVFDVPQDDGNVWEVCKIENGVLIPVNEMSYVEYPIDVGA